MRTTYLQGIRVFGSFDLVGSTALKLRMAGGSATSHDRPHWMKPLMEFFIEVPDLLRHRLSEHFDRYRADIHSTPVEIWRVTGDEILFVSGHLEQSAQIMVLARVFNSVLLQMDMKFLSLYGLGVKGVIWAAGFPIRNVEVGINPRAAPHIRFSTPNFEDAEPLPPDDGTRLIHEFQGPEIDLGFRLAALAQPRRIAASLEVAYFLAKNSLDFPDLAPKFHHVGWSRLKGVYGETPYPILWLDYNERPENRTSYEEEMSPFCRQFLSGAARRDANAIVQLERDYLADTKDFRIHPYISTDEKFDAGHKDQYMRFAKR